MTRKGRDEGYFWIIISLEMDVKIHDKEGAIPVNYRWVLDSISFA